MLVVTRFQVAVDGQPAFRLGVEQAHAALAAQPGYVEGHLGRNVDDPELWVLTTRWSGVGAYRRALSSYAVKVAAWQVLGQAIDEPGAFELVLPGDGLDEPGARGQLP